MPSRFVWNKTELNEIELWDIFVKTLLQQDKNDSIKLLRNGIAIPVPLFRESDFRSFHFFSKSYMEPTTTNSWFLYMSTRCPISDTSVTKKLANLGGVNSAEYNAILEFFAGHYPETPGGIHCEECENIHIVVYGSKTFQLWPYEILSSRRMSKDYDALTNSIERYLHQDESVPSTTPITLSPFEGVMIPRKQWHIASCLLPTFTVNLALYPLNP